jgi:hypothetical protein
MVLINILCFLLLVIGFIAYRHFFPKKKIAVGWIVFFCSLLPVISIFRVGDYQSGDFNAHVYRTIAFFDSLQEGIIRPIWPKDLNATYGYPGFLVGGPLAYYLGSFFHALGMSFIGSMKLVLATTFVGSAMSMYWWVKKDFGKTSGLVAAIFYIFAPFHLVDVHFRVSVGDSLIYCLLPFCFLSVSHLLDGKSRSWFFVLAASVALLCLSHPMALIAFGLLIVYVAMSWFVRKVPIKNIVVCGASILSGLLLSAFFWLPVLFESQYFYTATIRKAVEFAHLTQFLYAPWRLGFLYQGHQGELSYVIGYAQWFVVGYAVFITYKNFAESRIRKWLLLFLALFFVTFFLFFSSSKPIWDVLPVLQNLQFSYRLLLVEVFVTAVIAGLVAHHVKSKERIILLCLFAIVPTILNWGHRTVLPEVTDENLINNLPFSTSQGEGGDPAMPRWVEPGNIYMKVIPEQHIEVLTGSAELQEISRTSIEHVYIVYAKTPATLKENTLYFPGWQVFDNDVSIPIEFQQKKYPGIITFNIDKGLHIIRVQFKHTLVRQRAQDLSVVTLGVLFHIGGFLSWKRVT